VTAEMPAAATAAAAIAPPASSEALQQPKPAPPPPPPPPPVLSPAAAGSGPAAAAAAASKQTASNAPPPPPPPPPLPHPAAFNSSSTNHSTTAAAATTAELQLEPGVNVGPKAPPAAPGFNSAGLARSSSSIGPVSRVPGLVLHFQQLRQGELSKQYSHVAAAGSTAAARSPVKGRAADGAAAADPSQLLNEVRE
jgi:hypothetical protein